MINDTVVEVFRRIETIHVQLLLSCFFKSYIHISVTCLYFLYQKDSTNVSIRRIKSTMKDERFNYSIKAENLEDFQGTTVIRSLDNDYYLHSSKNIWRYSSKGSVSRYYSSDKKIVDFIFT